MKSKSKNKGFTIVELLTVMSIIVILIGMLLPSLQSVRRYSKTVRQKAQFKDITDGLEMFSIDFDGYPDSGQLDLDKLEYCGAMKLCEAMIGQDGLGFNPASKFKRDDGSPPNELYPDSPPDPPTSDPNYVENLRSRKAYLEIGKYKSATTVDLYGAGGAFLDTSTVICDVFGRVQGTTDQKLGMPVLYYRADTTKLNHDIDYANTSTYNYMDNHKLLDPALKVHGQTEDHPLHTNAKGIEGVRFYTVTRNEKLNPAIKPHNMDSYILISAGWDMLYGTRDDVFNFAQ